MTSSDTVGLVTGSTQIFSSELPVLLLKKIVSHVSPGLKFTISLKVIANNYFQLNCTGKFSVAYLHTITISKNKLGHVTLPESKMVERDVSISHCTDFVFLSISTLF